MQVNHYNSETGGNTNQAESSIDTRAEYLLWCTSCSLLVFCWAVSERWVHGKINACLNREARQELRMSVRIKRVSEHTLSSIWGRSLCNSHRFALELDMYGT